jgi:hypothetical protein
MLNPTFRTEIYFDFLTEIEHEINLNKNNIPINIGKNLHIKNY